MANEQFERILRQTLRDRRVSRGEKRVVQQILREWGAGSDSEGSALTEQQLGVLRHLAFEVARSELTDPESDQIVVWLEEVVKLLCTVTEPARPTASSSSPSSAGEAKAYFTPGDDCPRMIARLLEETRKRAEICVFTITDDRITRAIERLHGRGVALRIVSDNDKADDLGSDIYRLRAAGLPVRVDRSRHHMHHKFAVLDETITVTGSYNWTRSAAEMNEENLVVYRDPRLASEFLTEFERIWRNSE